jgi:hypothetical protein
MTRRLRFASLVGRRAAARRRAGGTEISPMSVRVPILAAVAVLVAGCGSGAAPSATPTAATVTPSAAPTAPAVTANATPTATTTALETVWHTNLVTQDDMRAALQAAGLQEWIQPFLSRVAAQQNVFTLRVLNGRWVQYWSKDGGPAEENDSGPYTITGDQVTVSHDDGGSDTYRWAVDGDTLTVTFLTDTFPPADGIPERVYQTAFYMASSWLRGAP